MAGMSTMKKNARADVLLFVLSILSPSLVATASGLTFPALLGEVVALLWLAFGRIAPEPARAESI